MPELPEVETVVRDLRKKVRGRHVTAVWFDWPKMIRPVRGVDYDVRDRQTDMSARSDESISTGSTAMRNDTAIRGSLPSPKGLRPSASDNGVASRSRSAKASVSSSRLVLSGAGQATRDAVDPADRADASQSRLHISQPAVKRFRKDLVGERILDVKRRAKNILIYLTHNKLLLIHQKMTGHLLVGKWKIKDNVVTPLSPEAIVTDPYNGFIHLILTLDNGQMLALSDVRKFAKAILGRREQIEQLPELAELGPDAVSPALTVKDFAGLIRSNGRRIKQVLMDPFVIAGIGNIYSDDILWQAKIHPERSGQSLTTPELKRLFTAMRSVLAKAVELRGTSTSDFRDTAGKEGGYTGHRLVYQRGGSPCRRCKTLIKRIVVGGRSAHFCPRCQK
jgi:formamidopyrimidine-DNA glycosylase